MYDYYIFIIHRNEFYQVYSTAPPIENISIYFECYENVNKWLLEHNVENTNVMEAQDHLTLITNSVESFKVLYNYFNMYNRI